MAQYFDPTLLTTGTFVSVELWNRLYGSAGSLVFLYDNYAQRTKGYHLKIGLSSPVNVSTSFFGTIINSIPWNTSIIDDYPSDSISMWNNDENEPDKISIIESGYYFIHAHINASSIKTNTPVKAVFAHIIRESGETPIITSIASNYLIRPVTASNRGYPTWSNNMANQSINVSTVVYLEKDEKIYVTLQTENVYDSSFTLIPTQYTFVPTQYSFTTQYSFVSKPYIGLSPAFLEIQSLKLEI